MVTSDSVDDSAHSRRRTQGFVAASRRIKGPTWYSNSPQRANAPHFTSSPASRWVVDTDRPGAADLLESHYWTLIRECPENYHGPPGHSGRGALRTPTCHEPLLNSALYFDRSTGSSVAELRCAPPAVAALELRRRRRTGRRPADQRGREETGLDRAGVPTDSRDECAAGQFAHPCAVAVDRGERQALQAFLENTVLS